MKFLENKKYVQRTVAQMCQVIIHRNVMNEILLNIAKLKHRRQVISLTKSTVVVLRYVC
jgi:hypothetical protein